MTTIRALKNGLVTGILFIAGLGLTAQAQIQKDLHVGNPAPVTNALGQKFPGSNGDPDQACKVEIRQVGAGILPPDQVTGEGHPNNPLLRASYMGHDITETDSGMFSEAFSTRLTNGVAYFARVFDAPLPANALYYADSAAFTNPPDSDYVDVVFQPFRLVSTSLPDEDTDGDGIPNTMESEVTGTSPSRWDHDGDGFGDYYELTHADYLRAKEADPIDLWLHAPQTSSEPYYVSWWAVPGLAYRLGYYTVADAPDVYSEVWSGTATETNLEIDVEDVMVDSNGFFRVFAVP